MAEPAASRSPSVSPIIRHRKSASADSPHRKILSRKSKELVIGLCGPIGSGIGDVCLQLKQVLIDEGYKTHVINVSELIESYCKRENIPLEEYQETKKADRYHKLMDAGNKLRSSKGNEICVDLAIAEISIVRQTESKLISVDEQVSSSLGSSKEDALEKNAYIIKQLKHPEEASALKRIYGNLFYMIGVLCDEGRREISLQDEGIDSAAARGLILRDKEEKEENGQKLEKTIFQADFFINNSDPNSTSINSNLTRFMRLLHGGRGITPTSEEYGMYAAYSASLQSACLSRQVGASILDPDGNVIAIGRNDVPKAGGGLYSEDDNIQPGMKDYRCVHKDQQCHNDLHKLRLKNTIITHLIEGLGGDEKLAEVLSADELRALGLRLGESISKLTQIKSLIEYSRAIHAEMDALISMSRNGKRIPAGSILYTTTYPCHSCARHIIAAGISKIKYIEPYEKSLALSLHDDAISHSEKNDKVQIQPFHGVSPRKYQVFFSNTTPEKDSSGKIIVSDRSDKLQVDPDFVDSYIERENAIFESLYPNS